MTREEAHATCLSRDCSCINGKDRDCNYHETIDKVFDDFEARICENCKHRIEIEKDVNECRILIVDCGIVGGCNRWKQNV